MTIDEAIVILTAMRDKTHIYDEHEIKVAESLGIEALKVVQQSRTKYSRSAIYLLPGETEE